MARQGTDIRQLLLQVDASVSLAQRNLNTLAAQVNKDAAAMDKDLAKVDGASDRLGKGFERSSQMAQKALVPLGQYRAGAQQLSFQIGDVAQQVALGQRPLTIFAQQSGQVIQAITLMKGTASGWLGFLAGPWGAVLTGATIILSQLVGKMLEGGNELDKLVDKMREQARQAALNKQADEAWLHTVEGLTEAIRKRREEQEKSLKTDQQAEQDSLDSARDDLAAAQKQRDDIAARLAAAKKELDAIKASPAGGPEAYQAGRQASIGAAEARIEKLRAELGALAVGVRTAEESVRGAEIVIGERRVEAQLSKVTAATDAYTTALGRLREERTKGLISQAEFERQLGAEQAKRDKAIEAANKEKRQGQQGGTTQFQLPVDGKILGKFGEKRPGHTHAGIDLAVPVGTPVKAAAGGTVIEVGTLPGYGNVVVIDHGGGTLSRYAHLSGFSVSKGQRVDQGSVIGLSGGAKGAAGSGNSQGPHVHYEVRRGGKAVNPQGSFPTDELAAAKVGERDAAAVARNENAFKQELLRLNEELLNLKRQGVVEASGQAEFAREAVQVELAARNAAVDAAQKKGDLAAAEAQQLQLANQAVADQKTANINAQESARIAQERNEVLRLASETEVDALEHQQELARTIEERKALQHQLVDAHTDLLIAAQDEIIASKETTEHQKEIARLTKARLEAQRGFQHDEVERRNRTPAEEYLDRLRRSGETINEQMEAIAVDGLEALNDGLVDVIMNAESLGDVFKKIADQIIADILRIVIQQALIKPMAELLGSGGDSGGGGGGLGGFLSAIGQVIGIGAGTGAPAAGGTGGGVPAGDWVGPRANGGSVWPGHPYITGERGPELIIPRTPGIVLPNRMMGGMGAAGRPLTIHVHAKDAVLASHVRQWVADGVNMAAQAGGEIGRARVLHSRAREIP